nr:MULTISPECIES: NUDIX hydrolase [unclassified Planococcus (in: firmicutes)]
MEGRPVKETKKVWQGAAGVVIDQDKILMVKSKASGKWSIPSGEIETGESPQQACVREVWEETGFRIDVKQQLHTKNVQIGNYEVTSHYFLCEVLSGNVCFRDPDNEIEEITWKTEAELKELLHDYPEDQEHLIRFMNRAASI